MHYKDIATEYNNLVNMIKHIIEESKVDQESIQEIWEFFLEELRV